MNKAELIDVLTQKLGSDRRQATAAVENVVDTIVRAAGFVSWPPAVLAAHREEQVKPVAPQIDIQFLRHHGTGRLGIGDEEHVLVGRARKRDAGELAHRAPGSIAPGDPRRHVAAVGAARHADPGRIDVEPGSTLLQVLAQAGGFTPFAAKKRIQLRRGSSVYLFNYNELEKTGGAGFETVVAKGDVIVIPTRRLFE